MAKYLSTPGEFSTALESAGDKLVVVDFTAKWCGPCKSIAPEYDSLVQTYPDILFYKVDVDENDDVAEKYDIQAMPTFIIFRNKQKLERSRGADIEKVKEMIKKNQK